MPRHHGRTRPRLRARLVPFDRPAEQQPGETIPAEQADAAQDLENLRVALRAADPGLFVRLVRPHSAPPYLHVNNPAGAGRFAEDIGVRHAAAPGDLDYYVWSWGEEITPVTTPKVAAHRIRKVLAAHRQEL
ncbi:hypothetical protein ACFY4C_14595 [Actinomadura viridis]|uniref:hypothetical protein n=1 Tax=Actinomadura viridis TaxID=58110 RepID=UPI0036ADF2B6